MAQVQAFGNCQVSLVVHFAQICERSAALPNKFEQTTTTRLIFFIDAEVIRQLLDATGEKRNLHFG
jgi:hypothetical protein